jgi:hypothetical protein
MLLLTFSATLAIGCGSSSSTSSAEAKSVSVAEQRFFMVLRQANRVAGTRCSRKSDQVALRCYQRIVESPTAKAEATFSESIEKLLKGGVGSKCADQLEEALSTMNSVPAFPGGTSSICRAESQETE